MDRSAQIKDFLFANNWFDQKYAENSGKRFATVKAALNFFLQRDVRTIVETGCTRIKDDWGAGYSTVMFGDFCKRYGAHLWTVDIDGRNLEMSRQLTAEFQAQITFVQQDSVAFFTTIPERADAASLKKIDLLYLDSFDYPSEDLLYVYGEAGKLTRADAERVLHSLSDEQIVEDCSEIIAPSQNHCLAELRAAQPFLHQGSVILIDDNDLPGGGKSRLAKAWLLENGFLCVLDRYQTLWIKG